MRFVVRILELFVAFSCILSLIMAVVLITDSEIRDGLKDYYKEVYQISFKKMKSELMMMALAAGATSATELTPEVCFLITHTLFGK